MNCRTFIGACLVAWMAGLNPATSQPVYPPFIPTIRAGLPTTAPPPATFQLYFENDTTPYTAWVYDPVAAGWKKYGGSGGGSGCSAGFDGEFLYYSAGVCVGSPYLVVNGTTLFLDAPTIFIEDPSDFASGFTQQSQVGVLQEAVSINLYAPSLYVDDRLDGTTAEQGATCALPGFPNEVKVLNGIVTQCQTVSSIDGSFLVDASVANSKLTNSGVTIAGNLVPLGGSLSAATLAAALPLFTSGAQGLVPASGGGTTNFLRADGTWASAGGTVTWPASGSAVISNTTNSPTGVAESDGKVLVGVSGAWAAGNVPLTTVTGGICTSTNFSIQFDNSGAMGCAPAIVNSGTWEFTGTTWQMAGFNVFTQPTGGGTVNSVIGLGSQALNNYSTGSNIVCIGRGACYSAATGGGNMTGVGDLACDYTGGASPGTGNSCFGTNAGQLVVGSNNTLIGLSSGAELTTATENTGVGENSMGANSTATGTQNTSIGGYSLQNFVAGSLNTAIGYKAGQGIGAGSDNLCLGAWACNAGTQLTTGSRNIVLAGNGSVVAKCAGTSSVSVNDEFDLCGNGSAAGDVTPIIRCNLASIASGNCKFNVPDASPGFTVSTLPAAPPTGSRAYVSDAVACTFVAGVTGGGTTFCPVIYNGTSWIAS